MADEETRKTAWHPYVLNSIAKEIRELFPMYDPREAGEWHNDTRSMNNTRRGAYCAIALCLAHRIKKDNPEFNHLKWLDQCSPDVEMFPLSELWEDEND